MWKVLSIHLILHCTHKVNRFLESSLFKAFFVFIIENKNRCIVSTTSQTMHYGSSLVCCMDFVLYCVYTITTYYKQKFPLNRFLLYFSIHITFLCKLPVWHTSQLYIQKMAMAILDELWLHQMKFEQWKVLFT